MDKISFAPWKDEDLAQVMDLWQRTFADRKYDFRIDAAGFRQRVLAHPDFEPEGAITAKVEGRVVGFVLAVAPGPGETGYLSVLVVDSDYRRIGVGGRLANAAERFSIWLRKNGDADRLQGKSDHIRDRRRYEDASVYVFPESGIPQSWVGESVYGNDVRRV